MAAELGLPSDEGFSRHAPMSYSWGSRWRSRWGDRLHSVVPLQYLQGDTVGGVAVEVPVEC